MLYVLLYFLGAWLIGTPIASILTRQKGEAFYFYRGYQYYKRGDVGIAYLIGTSIGNISLGTGILIIIGAFFLDSLLPWN
jgi:hypothetical protein